MKKTFAMAIMLMVALLAQAQSLKVSPKLQKGDKKVYVTEATTEVAGQKFKVTTETQYTVVDETSDGYILEMENTAVSSDADANNILGKIMTISEEMVKGIKIRVLTDKDGKSKGLQNYEEVKQKAEVAATKLIDELLAATPQLAQMMPKETLMGQITDALTEENLVKSLQNATSPLTLNGKTIITGAQEEYTSDQGIKMKRIYLLMGKTITATSTMNMSKDELKQLIISQVEKMAPDQADMVKQNIDMVMASMKFEMTDKATYELQDDGWVKGITEEMNSEQMGQKSSVSTTVKLK